MKRTYSLDDLALFVAVADSGGLAGAARATGSSVPTLSRRMTRLETDIGQRLFARGPRGYSLTGAGRALLAEADGLRGINARVSRFADRDRAVPVRITAGHWTSMFLARTLPQHWSVDANWRPEFLPGNAYVDIARREADIGIRNRRPDQPWLAGRMTWQVAFAPFSARADIQGFVAIHDSANLTRSEIWLRENHPEEIVAQAATARLAADMAIAGMGQVVLPTFIAPFLPELQRSGPDIDALALEEWLVSHHEARHDPPIRAALDAIGTILTNRPR